MNFLYAFHLPVQTQTVPCHYFFKKNMEGYTSFYKFQTEAAMHLLRWGADFTEKVWAALCGLLHPHQQDSDGKPRDYISAAFLLRRQDTSALASFATKCNITEKQVWALLINQADPEVTSLDRLSDARDQIHRITVQEDYAQQQQLHDNFNLGTSTRQLQSEKAKYERGKLGDDQEVTMRGIVRDLVNSPLNRQLAARDLWDPLFSELEKHHLDPEEDKSNPKNPRYSYDGPNGRKTLTFKSFANIVSKLKQ
jgi:hypothetical protein